MNRAILFVVLTLFAFVAVAPLAAQTSTENGPHTCNDCSETINVTAPAPRSPEVRDVPPTTSDPREGNHTEGREPRVPAWEPQSGRQEKKLAAFKAALAQLDRDIVLAEVNRFLETHGLDDCHQIANDPDLVDEAMALIRVKIDEIWHTLRWKDKIGIHIIYGERKKGRANTIRAFCTAMRL